MLPMKNLANITMQAAKDYGKDDGGNLAAALAFAAFFSIFPLVLFLVSLAGLVVSPQAAQQWVLRSLPIDPNSAAGNVFVTTVTSVIAARGASKGIGTAVGLIGLLLSASGVFGTLEKAINRAWGCQDKSGLIKDKIVAFIMVLGFGLLLVASTVVSSLLNGIQAGVGGIIGDFPWLWQIVNILVAIALMSLALAILFRALPHCRVSWQDAWPGAILVAIGLQILQQGFAFYLGHFANYQAVYGTLGGIIALQTLIYLACQILIFGAEFSSDYEAERRKLAEDEHKSTKQAAEARRRAVVAARTAKREQERAARPSPPPVRGPVGQAPPEATAGVLGAAVAVAAAVGFIGRLITGERHPGA